MKSSRTRLQLFAAVTLSALLALSSTAAANAVAYSHLIDLDFRDGGFAVTSPTGDTVALSTYGGENVSVDPSRIDPPKLFIIDVATDAVTLVDDPDSRIQEGGEPAYSPDGETIYLPTAKNNPGIAIVDVASRTVTGFIDGTLLTPQLDSPWLAKVSPDGTTLYVLNYGNTTVIVLDIASGEVTTTIPVPHAGQASNMFLSPDGTRLTLLKYGNETDTVAIDVVNLGTTPTVNTLDISSQGMGDYFWSGCVSTDGNTLYVPNHQGGESGTAPNVTYDDDFVLVVSLLDGTTTKTEILNSPVAFTMCAVSEDGSTLYVTDQNGLAPTPLTTFSTSTLQRIETIDLVGLAYGEGIAVAGSKAYVSGFYGDIGVLTGLPILPEQQESGVDGGSMLANTGSHDAANTANATFVAGFAILLGASVAFVSSVQRRRRH